MYEALHEQFLKAMHHFKHAVMSYPGGLGIHAGEMMVLQKLAAKHGCVLQQQSAANRMNVSELHASLSVSKPAVSQILNSLEKKGYVKREIDAEDRRKIAVTLTPLGQEMVWDIKKQLGGMMDELIKRYGEEDMRTLVKMISRLTDVYRQMQEEMSLNEERKTF
ncbi:MAG: MarR family winged helix-turn-helix transcriptional regulator [Christensenellales bacterium]|jgi:DNA-binding MarR family transcriptional regulator